MIALGVLAIGMGMAAGAFHAGIQNHIITVDEIHRTMIGENAVAIAKARLNADVNLPDPIWDPQKKEYTLKWVQLSGSEINQRLGAQDVQYPIGLRSTHGFFALGARAKPKPSNDFKFMVIIYEILEAGAGQDIDVGLREVKDVPITREQQTGKWVAVVTPNPYQGITVRTVLPVGALIYMPELEDPFVEVTNHIGMTMAVLDREFKSARTRDLLVMTVKIGGQLSGALKIRGVYRGRTSLQPAPATAGPGVGG